jgi:hypothetical protein
MKNEMNLHYQLMSNGVVELLNFIPYLSEN